LNKLEFENHIQNWSEFNDLNYSIEGDAGKVRIVSGNKEVQVTAAYNCEEFFIDFFQDGDALYSDWYESMNEPVDEMMGYTKEIAIRYLNYPVRVKSSGWWIFKTPVIEYQVNEQWLNVFESDI
jgi:hypothetical protein